MLKLFAVFFLLLLIASVSTLSTSTSARTLKEYYSKPVPKLLAVEYKPLLAPTRIAQFRPSPEIYRTTTDLQNDVHRLVIQQLKYPWDRVPTSEVQWIRENRPTIYDPLGKKTRWTKEMNDDQLKKLLIRPDVRTSLGFELLPFKPTTYS